MHFNLSSGVWYVFIFTSSAWATDSASYGGVMGEGQHSQLPDTYTAAKQGSASTDLLPKQLRDLKVLICEKLRRMRGAGRA